MVICNDAIFPWVGQVSIAGSAIATLQKELSASHGAQKIIKPVKAPTHRAVEMRLTPEPSPPPFRDERYQAQYETQLQREIGAVHAGGMEQAYGEWEAQVCCLVCSGKKNPS